MTLRLAPKFVATLAFVVFLSACDSAEDRAEEHYQNALALIEEGDVERAMIEFRNVLSLDELHTEARTAFAKFSRDIGNIPESYAQYLRLVEQTPDDLEARLALAEMAILAQNWEEAERHGAALAEFAEGSPEARAVDLALRFREAALSEDAASLRELTREATELDKELPGSEIIQLVAIEGHTRAGDMEKALAVIDEAIATHPEDRKFYIMKSGVLNHLENADALEAHLRSVVATFPEDAEFQATLVRLLASQGKVEQAEVFIREQLALAEEKQVRHVGLITFIRQTQGDEAALEEIETAIATYEDDAIFTALRAGILFDRGEREDAIAAMQSVVDNAEEGETADRYKVTLARMLATSGNDVGARQLVEDVLARDPTQVEALKMSAEWQIESDQTEAAIAALSQVLDQSPDDADAMTLMARAHQRNGSPELAQDLLALAVEASNNAPEESLRFARRLVDQEQFRSAEDVLIAALRASPGNLALLGQLGDIHIRTADYPRALQVEATLRRQDDAQATRIADRLKLQIINQRDGREQAVAFLETLATQEGSATAAKASLLSARLAEGDSEAALALAQELVSDNPDDPRIALVVGNTHLALRDFEAAEAEFQKVTDTNPENATAWAQLVRAQSAQGEAVMAESTVDKGLAANPKAGNLLWAKASFLESANDIDGAIDIYQTLYEENPNSLIVANNLASLLATYREDDESLERAYSVARRLQGTSTPPFQDTIGWILFRRGDVAEALQYLEPAASALRDDPIVQYHLAKAYLAAERENDALEAFRRAVDIAEPQDERDQIVEARSEVERLTQ